MKYLIFIFLSLFIPGCVKSYNDSKKDVDSVIVMNNNSINFHKYENLYSTVFLNIDYNEPILLQTKNGDVILKNDSIKSKYYNFTLLSKNNTQYYVIAWDALTLSFIDIGYISKNTPICIFSRAYNYPLKIFRSPHKSSLFVSDTSYHAKQLKVCDFHQKWLKIRLPHDDADIEGWISSDQQCYNVFSTCG